MAPVPTDLTKRPRQLEFCLRSSDPDVAVDVRLRAVDERWVAVAQVADARQVGLGRTARAALTSAVQAAAPRASAELLADPQLLAVSLRARVV